MKKNIFQKEAKKAFLIELNELKAFYASKDFNVGDLCQEILNCKGKVFLTGVANLGILQIKFQQLSQVLELHLFLYIQQKLCMAIWE